MTGPRVAVLTDAIRQEIGGERVKALVMTTFVLEWGFTLEEVLPAFVPHSLSRAPVIRREEIADHFLKSGTAASLFFDAAHPQDVRGASRIPLSLVPVTHGTGVFHPKVVLALVGSPGDERLVVAVGSANLTQAGWWESLECAHITSISARSRSWSANALLSFLDYLRKQCHTRSQREAPDQIRRFVKDLRQAERLSTSDRGTERFIWNGRGEQEGLVDQVLDVVGDWYAGGYLEIISPWYGSSGVGQLRILRGRSGVRRVRYLLPRDEWGASLVSEVDAAALGELSGWGNLPASVLKAGTAQEEHRTVHAKAYRFTNERASEQTFVVGSFNLTAPAFQAGGNVEAAFVVDLPTGGKEAWLERVPAPTVFGKSLESEEAEEAPQGAAAWLFADWERRECRVEWSLSSPPPELIALKSGARSIMTLSPECLSLSEPQFNTLAEELRSSGPFFDAFDTSGNELGYVMVSESGLMRKPTSARDRELTDALQDILLDPDVRRDRDGSDEGDSAEHTPRDSSPERNEPDRRDFFTSTAALFEAMVLLEQQLRTALEAADESEVRYRLEGEGARCVGDVLTQAERVCPEDPVRALLTGWALVEVLGSLRPRQAKVKKAHKVVSARASGLADLAENLLREKHADDPDFGQFIAWAEGEFQRREGTQ